MLMKIVSSLIAFVRIVPRNQLLRLWQIISESAFSAVREALGKTAAFEAG